MDVNWNSLPAHLSAPDPNIYRSNNYVSLDYETTTLDYGDSRNPNNSILLSCWRRGSGHPRYNGSPIAVWGGEFDLGDLVRDIEEADYLVAHNTKFELGWLYRCGLDLSNVVVWCTQIGEYVLAGNRQWSLHLSDTSKRRGYGDKDFIGQLIRQGVDTRDIPGFLLERYCHKDVALCERIFRHQRDHIYRRGLEAVTYTRNLLTPVLVDIERNGMCLDEERVEQLYFRYANKLVELERKFDKLTGGVNPRSPKQLQELIYDKLKFTELQDYKGRPKRTASGGRKTDKQTLSELAKQASTPHQKKFINLKTDINKYKDALSKTLEKFHLCVTETKDNVLFANLHQTITQTHRLSSSGTKYKVQFQNIDRNFKPLIRSRKSDWSFAEYDFAQLEYRTAVYLGDDDQGRANIADPSFDAHVFSAAVMHEWNYDDAFRRYKKGDPDVKSARQDAKPDTFKPLYGGQSGTEAQQKYYAAFRDTYPGINGVSGKL